MSEIRNILSRKRSSRSNKPIREIPFFHEPHIPKPPPFHEREYAKVWDAVSPHIVIQRERRSTTKQPEFRGGWSELKLVYGYAIKNTFAKKYIDGCGWTKLFEIDVPLNDKKITEALIERWWYTTHTFHLPMLEIGFTPVDFTVLTGIPCGSGGVPPFWHEQRDDIEDFKTYFPRLFSLTEDNVKITSNSIRVSTLKKALERFSTAQTESSNVEEQEAEGQEIARIFFMWVVGQLFFPQASNNVSLRWLAAFDVLDKVCSYDWGSAIMGRMYKSLNECCLGQNSFNGMWFILEYWFYAHFNDLVPVLLDTRPHTIAKIPLIAAYNKDNRGDQSGTGKHVFITYRGKLESRSPDGLVWDPYVEIKEKYCNDPILQAALAHSEKRCILFDPETNEGWWYLADRCWRQLHPNRVFIPANPPPYRTLSRVPRQIFDDLKTSGWESGELYCVEKTAEQWKVYWKHVSKGICFPTLYKEENRVVESNAPSQDPQFAYTQMPSEYVDLSEYCNEKATIYVSRNVTSPLVLNINPHPDLVYQGNKHTTTQWALVATALKEENRALREALEVQTRVLHGMYT